MGTCAICGAQVPPEELLGHLRGAHGIEEEIATWPDGEPVVIDQTLQPDDFDQSLQPDEPDLP